jgi:hypothetical protein
MANGPNVEGKVLVVESLEMGYETKNGRTSDGHRAVVFLMLKLSRQFSLYGCSYISVGARGGARVVLDPFVLENVIRLR